MSDTRRETSTDGAGRWKARDGEVCERNEIRWRDVGDDDKVENGETKMKRHEKEMTSDQTARNKESTCLPELMVSSRLGSRRRHFVSSRRLRFSSLRFFSTQSSSFRSISPYRTPARFANMMAFPWSRPRQRDPSDLSRAIKDLLAKVTSQGKSSSTSKYEADLIKQLEHVKVIVQEADTQPRLVDQLLDCFIKDDIFFELARNMRSLNFQGRKDTQAIFSYCLRFRADDHPPLIQYIYHKPETLVQLCFGYESADSAIQCGSIVREALKFRIIAEMMYSGRSGGGPAADEELSKLLTNFFTWIDRGNFQVSADAFTTFREILTQHKDLVSTYLVDESNFNSFFTLYNEKLVSSHSYVTKRQSIKLLGELLLDRCNYELMTRYVASGEHLKLYMQLLRDQRKMVQYEAFHIFKIFVANPHKSPAVLNILTKNRDRLLNFLPTFLEDRTEDDQFLDEKSFLIHQINLLSPK